MARLFLIILFLLAPFTHLEAKPFVERWDVRAFINKTAKKYDLPKSYLQKYLEKVKLQNRIVSKVKRPTEAKPWSQYEQLFVTPKRVEQGIAFWQKHKETLAKAEKTYGVEPEILVAILGVETNYGEVQGSFRVLDSLATLSFKYTARARFFKKELAEFFKLCREQGIAPTSVYGSYAGAIGQPQFMPSSYRYYAVDFSNDGKKDLRGNTKDAIGSIANYFSRHGWKKSEHIAEPAIVKGKRYYLLKKNPRKARYSLKTLQRFGVKPTHSNEETRASLITLKNKNSREHWIAYQNFFVITRYNTSKQYAMAVHHLAQKLKAGFLARQKKPQKVALKDKEESVFLM